MSAAAGAMVEGAVKSGIAMRAEGLVKSYGRRRVVDGVSLEIAPGEVVGLLGPNGAGKTTTFRMVAGLLAPEAGSVFLGGRDVTAEPLHVRARQGLAYLPQEPSVFRGLTVRENLLAVLELGSLSKGAQQERADALIEELGLGTVAGSRASTLSGGERRRTEIARALCGDPMLLMLDEPFAGIDPRAVEELTELIGRLRERRMGILLTDHLVREALSVCDRAYLLDRGALLEEGRPEELAASHRARDVYLGDRFSLN